MRKTTGVSFLLFLTACAGTPATPAETKLAERRMLQPFLRDVEVRCDELVVEMTGNFYVNVSQPAIDVRQHDARKEPGAGWLDTVWVNKLGAPGGAFLVVIGEASPVEVPGRLVTTQTRFRVGHQVRFRVFEGEHPLTLVVRATGAPVRITEGASRGVQEGRELVVVDGDARVR